MPSAFVASALVSFAIEREVAPTSRRRGPDGHRPRYRCKRLLAWRSAALRSLGPPRKPRCTACDQSTSLLRWTGLAEIAEVVRAWRRCESEGPAGQKLNRRDEKKAAVRRGEGEVEDDVLVMTTASCGAARQGA
jgi:hypothetical protein